MWLRQLHYCCNTNVLVSYNPAAAAAAAGPAYDATVAVLKAYRDIKGPIDGVQLTRHINNMAFEGDSRPLANNQCHLTAEPYLHHLHPALSCALRCCCRAAGRLKEQQARF
jgi:hypothetical protein